MEECGLQGSRRHSWNLLSNRDLNRLTRFRCLPNGFSTFHIKPAANRLRIDGKSAVIREAGLYRFHGKFRIKSIEIRHNGFRHQRSKIQLFLPVFQSEYNTVVQFPLIQPGTSLAFGHRYLFSGNIYGIRCVTQGFIELVYDFRGFLSNIVRPDGGFFTDHHAVHHQVFQIMDQISEDIRPSAVRKSSISGFFRCYRRTGRNRIHFHSHAAVGCYNHWRCHGFLPAVGVERINGLLPGHTPDFNIIDGKVGEVSRAV